MVIFVPADWYKNLKRKTRLIKIKPRNISRYKMSKCVMVIASLKILTGKGCDFS